ncbi:MAG: hypothetical protein JJU00_18835 [Opitutales bacterium]|nr:hypothetical protein [Opitutales bacterium]
MACDDAPHILLCFGDSITQNGHWVSDASAPEGWKLRNAGRSGRRAAHIAEELPTALDAHPDATHLLLLLGVNDLPSRDPRPGPERVAGVLADIDKAVTLALPRFRPGRIILAAPADVAPDRLSDINLGKGYDATPPLLADLEGGLRGLAARRGTRFVSFLHSVSPENLRDGLHPTPAGDAEIARDLRAHLARPEPPLPRLYLVGDSISINYHEALEELCKGRYHYTRKGGLESALRDLDSAQGANGGDSARVLAHLRAVIASGADIADTFLVNCGLHDIKTDPKSGEKQVPLPEYRRNLEEIATLVTGVGKRLIWITTTSVDEARHQRHQGSFHRYEADLAAYNTAAAEIMEQRGIDIIDLHAFTAALGPNIYRDHVHFIPEVSARQAEFIRASLDKLDWPRADAPSSDEVTDPTAADRSY